ncbi:hypothetical protein pb186bvf_013064 [Paramecium bursaria]
MASVRQIKKNVKPFSLGDFCYKLFIVDKNKQSIFLSFNPITYKSKMIFYIINKLICIDSVNWHQKHSKIPIEIRETE